MKIKQEIYRKLVHLSSIWVCILYYFLEKFKFLIILANITILLLFIDILRLKSKLISQKIINLFSSIIRSHETRQISGATYFMLGCLITSILFDKNLAIISILVLIFADSFAAFFGRLITSKGIFISNISYFFYLIITLYTLFSYLIYSVNSSTIYVISIIILSIYIIYDSLRHNASNNKSFAGSIGFMLAISLIMLLITRLSFINIVNFNINFYLAMIIAGIFACITEIMSVKLKIDDNLTVPISFAASFSIIQAGMHII